MNFVHSNGGTLLGYVAEATVTSPKLVLVSVGKVWRGSAA